MSASASVERFQPPMFYFQTDRGYNGEPITYIRMSNFDHNKHSLPYSMSQMVPFVEYGTLTNLNNSKLQGISIVDMREWSWSHLWAVGIEDAKLMFELTEKSLPITTGSTHICYESWIVSALFKLCQPFMSDELKDKIKFYGDDVQSLQQILPKSVIPNVLGGDAELYRSPEPKLKHMDKVLEEYYEQWPVDIN